MAQLGGFVALQPPLAEPGQDFFFGGVDNVKWRKPLVPGDVLVMEMHVTNFKKRFGICKMQGKGYVDGKVAFALHLADAEALLEVGDMHFHHEHVAGHEGLPPLDVVNASEEEVLSRLRQRRLQSHEATKLSH